MLLKTRMPPHPLFRVFRRVFFEQRESGLRGVVVGEGWSLEPDSRGEKGKGTAKPESAGGSNQVEISRARVARSYKLCL